MKNYLCFGHSGGELTGSEVQVPPNAAFVIVVTIPSVSTVHF